MALVGAVFSASASVPPLSSSWLRTLFKSGSCRFFQNDICGSSCQTIPDDGFSFRAGHPALAPERAANQHEPMQQGAGHAQLLQIGFYNTIEAQAANPEEDGTASSAGEQAEQHP